MAPQGQLQGNRVKVEVLLGVVKLSMVLMRLNGSAQEQVRGELRTAPAWFPPPLAQGGRWNSPSIAYFMS